MAFQSIPQARPTKGSAVSVAWRAAGGSSSAYGAVIALGGTLLDQYGLRGKRADVAYCPATNRLRLLFGDTGRKLVTRQRGAAAEVSVPLAHVAESHGIHAHRVAAEWPNPVTLIIHMPDWAWRKEKTNG